MTSAVASRSADRNLAESGAFPSVMSDRERIEEVFGRQRRLRRRVPDLSSRRASLKLLLAWVEANMDEIRRAGAEDFKKPPVEVDLTEIMPVLSEGRFALANLRKWTRPRRVAPTLALASTRARVHYEPRGVVLIISPWNYPFNLTVGPLISALAAGNRVILKPSESTPHMSALLRRMVCELFDDDEVALFEGEADVAEILLSLPFDHVFFTGSPAIGRRVMRAAAEHLTTVTLELGGKSPVVIDESAALGDAAKKIVFGKWINAGQTCIAPDYALVDRRVMPDLLDRLSAELRRAYGESSEQRRRSGDLARIVNRRHFDRLVALLEGSLEAGARVAFGGERDAEDLWIEPTLLVEAGEETPVMQEEIFGPILPILPYDDLDEALDLIARRPKPLALYFFSRRRPAIERVLEQTSAGGTCVNEVAVHFLHPRLPFGGVNESGHGSAHGYHGFRAFSHERAVLTHHRWSPFKLLAPPYTGRVQALARLTRRLF